MAFKLDGTRFKAWTDAGAPLVGGKLYTYSSGTTTPKATYTDSTLGSANTNPIILDARGEADVWLGSGAYTFLLQTSAGVTVDTVDGVVDPQAAAESAIRADLASTASGKGAELVGEQRAESGARPRTVRDKSREALSMLDFCVGDGTTDETAQVLLACACANSANLPLDLQGKTYLVSGGTLDLPVQGFVGQGRITGATCRWKELQQVQQEGEFRCDSLIIDSIWYSSFDRLWVNGQLTIQSANAAWGTFWNTFSHVQCGLLLFDAGQGNSVNLNRFGLVRANGGVKVVAAGATSSDECHANYIDVLDTTGANITAAGGTAGCHIVNDSTLNQRNSIGTWYGEVSGSCVVQGNWDIRGSHVDASGGFLRAGRKNHFLGAGGTSRNGDFLAAAPVNKARGGDWKQLQTNGRPFDTSYTGGMTVSVINATDPPDGNPLAVQCTATGTFQSVTITYPLGSSQDVSLTAFVHNVNSVSMTVEIDRAGSVFSTTRSLVDVGSGWSLLRVSGEGKYIGDGSGSTSGFIRLYVTTGSLPSPAPVFELGSFFLSNEQTCFLPGYSYGLKEAFGTTAPTAGIWQQGDRCWNTGVAAAGVPGWVCVTSGSPGTWKAMAAVAA